MSSRARVCLLCVMTTSPTIGISRFEEALLFLILGVVQRFLHPCLCLRNIRYPVLLVTGVLLYEDFSPPALSIWSWETSAY